MQKARQWISLLLCLALLAGLCACAAAETKQSAQADTITETLPLEAESASAIPDEASDPLSSRAVMIGNEDLVPEYERVDVDAALDDCERLAAATDPDELIALYDSLYAQYCAAASASAVASVCSSADVTDDYWAEQSVWSVAAADVIADALRTACSAVLNGPCADALREHVGDDAAEVFLSYTSSDDTIAELLERESELCSDYYRLDNEVRTTPVEIDGESWSYEMLYSEQGDDLYYNDYDRYAQIEQAVFRRMNEQLGSLYVQLVSVRQQLAKQSGYDSYSDYAYENLYGRSYSGEQAQLFCDAVKQIAKNSHYFRDVYYTDIGFDYDFTPLSPEELIAILGTYAADIDPLVYAGWEYMTENDLCLLTTDSVCDTGGYTLTFPSTGTPYIYDYIAGDAAYDFDGLSHEFGHFMNFWFTQSPNELVYAGDFDVSEIHSTGLEMLYAAFYGDIFGDGARTATCALLLNQIDNVITGCISDEFQRRVYATENITLDDVNRIYSEVCMEYGRYDEPQEDYDWMFVHHNFDYPLYYISYAASSLVALQIWEMSQSDYDAAVQLWLTLTHEGGYTKSYSELVSECGLSGFSDEKAVENICAAALDYLLQNG